MFKKFKWLIVAGAAVLLITAIAIPAMAAGPSTSPPAVNQRQLNGLGLGAGTAISESVAQLLGMTSDEIQAERLAGKSLVQIAAAKGVSETDLVAAILKDKQAALQVMVEDGTITQAIADLRLVQMTERVQLAVSRTTVGAPEWAGGNRNSNSRGNAYGRTSGQKGSASGMDNSFGNGRAGNGRNAANCDGSGICTAQGSTN